MINKRSTRKIYKLLPPPQVSKMLIKYLLPRIVLNTFTIVPASLINIVIWSIW